MCVCIPLPDSIQSHMRQIHVEIYKSVNRYQQDGLQVTTITAPRAHVHSKVKRLLCQCVSQSVSPVVNVLAFNPKVLATL